MTTSRDTTKETTTMRAPHLYLDELNNDSLVAAYGKRLFALDGSDRYDVEYELARVEQVITEHALTGADINYFDQRSQILRGVLGQ